VELDRVRAPFLDLDWNNNSGVFGVTNATTYVPGGDAVPLADPARRQVRQPGRSAARFRDGNDYKPSRRRCRATGRGHHGHLHSKRRMTRTPGFCGCLCKGGRRKTISAYTQVLWTVTYSNDSTAPTLLPRSIAFAARGYGATAPGKRAGIPSSQRRLCVLRGSVNASGDCGEADVIDQRPGNEPTTTVVLRPSLLPPAACRGKKANGGIGRVLAGGTNPWTACKVRLVGGCWRNRRDHILDCRLGGQRELAESARTGTTSTDGTASRRSTR